MVIAEITHGMSILLQNTILKINELN